MSLLTQAGEVVLAAVLALIRTLPTNQQQAVLDAAKERIKFDKAGNAKLAARKAALKKNQ
jgi:hypothetical protein